ncbi:MAG TPA: hypothetical protein VFN09_10990, partial [Rhodanobacteraceae bacterium]|nr:hypothetical protein [Rhodanobacteraceae bacterium]
VDMRAACHSTYDGMIDTILEHLGPMYIGGQLQTTFTLIEHRQACIAQGTAYEKGVENVSAANYYIPAQNVGICISAHKKRKLYCGN